MFCLHLQSKMSTTFVHHSSTTKYEAAPIDRTTQCHIPQDSNRRDTHIPSHNEIWDTYTDQHLSLGATWSGRRLLTFQTKCLHLHIWWLYKSTYQHYVPVGLSLVTATSLYVSMYRWFIYANSIISAHWTWQGTPVYITVMKILGNIFVPSCQSWHTMSIVPSQQKSAPWQKRGISKYTATN